MIRFSGPPMASAVLLIYFYLPFLMAVDIGDVFVVKSGTINGGCDSYSTDLAQFWTDSQKLAQAGADAYTDAIDGNAVALATLAGYFGITTGTTDVSFKFGQPFMNAVNDFFQGRAQFEDNQKPFLFCNSDWLIEFQRTDVAKEVDGMPWPGGNPPAIKDIPAYRAYLFNNDYTPTNNLPYWSSDIKEYLFFGPKDGSAYCSEKKNLGGTQTDTVPNTVTLCMQNIINAKPLRDAALGDTPATVRKFVKTLVPQAATLFHEAFHVALGVPATPDVTYSLTSIQDVIKTVGALSSVPATTNLDEPTDGPANNLRLTNKQLIARNPETYTFFATAYWEYQNSGETLTLATGQAKAL